MRPETKALIQAKWPQMRSVCPGLDKHATSLAFVEAYDNFDYASPGAERASVVFRVTEDKGKSSQWYVRLAVGHRCFFEISRDGSTAMIPKPDCQAICLDKDMSEHQGILKIPLK